MDGLDDFDYAPFDFSKCPKDIAAIDFLIAAKEIIKRQYNENNQKVTLSEFDKLFEQKCDEFDIFKIQRLSLTSLLFIDEWTIRGYVARHCFEPSPLPKEQREARMKVVLRYPHLPDCQTYRELGLGVGKDNNYLTILHPAIHSTIIT